MEENLKLQKKHQNKSGLVHGLVLLKVKIMSSKGKYDNSKHICPDLSCIGLSGFWKLFFCFGCQLESLGKWHKIIVFLLWTGQDFEREEKDKSGCKGKGHCIFGEGNQRNPPAHFPMLYTNTFRLGALQTTPSQTWLMVSGIGEPDRCDVPCHTFYCVWHGSSASALWLDYTEGGVTAKHLSKNYCNVWVNLEMRESAI